MSTQDTDDDIIVVYTKWITIAGKRVYAYQKGLSAFRLEIPRSRYKPNA